MENDGKNESEALKPNLKALTVVFPAVDHMQIKQS